jgi:RNA polymerase sigma-70 factor, ECF subfamily
MQGGTMDTLLQLLTEDATFSADGGGKASATLKVLQGADKVMRFLQGVATKGAALFTTTTHIINGRLGVLLYNLEGSLEGAFTFDVTDDRTRGDEAVHAARIRNIYAIRNPDKLARLAEAVTAASR